jgi:hypothetical protein
MVTKPDFDKAMAEMHAKLDEHRRQVATTLAQERDRIDQQLASR